MEPSITHIGFSEKSGKRSLLAFNYDETDDEIHGDIMRNIINGNIQDLDQHYPLGKKCPSSYANA